MLNTQPPTSTMSDTSNPAGPPRFKPRTVLSFVRRSGRLTQAQTRALDTLWATYGIEVHEHEIDFTEEFSHAGPITLEIGFGSGTSLATMAAADPARLFIGIEVYTAGVGQLLSLIEEQQISNLRVMQHDAIDVLSQMIPPASLDRVQLFFPDPWPKKRHHKRRIVKTDFLDLIASRITPGGIFHMATDWEHYAMEALSRLEAHPRFRNISTENGFVPRPESRPLTKFERRGQRLQHGVWDMMFECIQSPALG